MPGLDGKGPNGQGSMSGRGLGRCAGEENLNDRDFLGRGRRFAGRGRGLGMGRRNRFFAPKAADTSDAKE